MSKNNTINILICLDDLDGNYTRHCAVTMLSVLETNKNNKIKFYIISSCLPEDNINELNRIVNEHNQEIEFIIHDNIIPEHIKSLLINHVNLTRGTRYRLFFNLYIKDIDRILYLDCDTIVVKDLSGFYNTNMEGKAIVGYYDTEAFRYLKKNLDTNNYINAGVLLIDIKEYNKYPITVRKIENVNKKYGKRLNYADQDYLNILFVDNILIYKKQINYLIEKPFFNKGINNATIIHCLSKPYTKYPLCPGKIVKLYHNYLNKTKWKGFPKKIDKTLWCYVCIFFYFFIIGCIEKIYGNKGIIWFNNLKIKKRAHKLLGIKNY